MVSLTQGHLVYFVVLHHQAVEHTVAASTFSELSLVCWQVRLTATSAMSNSANVKLTPAAMVDNLAESIDKCPLNRDR